MITKSEAQSISESQLMSTAVTQEIETAVRSAAQLGGYVASYTFPVDYSSANDKLLLAIKGLTVGVTTAQTLGVNATYTGTPAGAATPVTITADATGAAGNDISLGFDGVLTISAVLAAWNLANPSNTASLISGDGDQVPNNLQVIDLASGVTAVAEVISITFSAP